MTMIRKSVSLALVAGMVLPVSAALAANLYGGGATFPAVPYVGDNFKISFAPDARLATGLGNTPPAPFQGPATVGGIFGAFSSSNASAMSYCQTGSGTGKNVYTGSVTPSSGPCRDFSVSAVAFSSPQVDYAGSDSPLTQGDVNNFNTFVNPAPARPKSAPVQIPSLAGTIALPFKYNTVSSSLNLLTVADVCNIFAGVYDNWNDIPGLGLPAKPIRIVYRTDGSGTSFAFTNFLAANCNATQLGPIPDRSPGNAWFQANQAFNLAVPATGGVPNYPNAPIPASGNADLVTQVYANDGAIGYADPGDVAAVSGTYFTINGASPMSFTLAAIPNTAVRTGDVVSAAGSTSTGLPTVTAATGTPAPSSIVLIDPAYKPAAGYPIVAFTYLEFYRTGQNSTGGVNNSASLQCLVKLTYNRASAGGCNSFGLRPALPTGYAYINDTIPAVRTKIDTAIGSILP